MTTILRPGQRLVFLPPGAMTALSGRVSLQAGDNWWEAGGATGCVAAYQPKGAASLAASYVNLANPGTYDATAPVAAPTFDTATGWTFAHTTTYLATGIIPSAATWTMIARTGARTQTAYHTIAEGGTGTKLFGLWAQGTTDQVGYVNAGVANTTPMLSTSGGVLCVAGATGYRDGASEATITQGAVADTAVVIGKSSRYLTSHGLNGQLFAFAIYDNTLDAAEVAAVSAAMAAL